MRYQASFIQRRIQCRRPPIPPTTGSCFHSFKGSSMWQSQSRVPCHRARPRFRQQTVRPLLLPPEPWRNQCDDLNSGRLMLGNRICTKIAEFWLHVVCSCAMQTRKSCFGISSAGLQMKSTIQQFASSLNRKGLATQVTSSIWNRSKMLAYRAAPRIKWFATLSFRTPFERISQVFYTCVSLQHDF